MALGEQFKNTFWTDDEGKTQVSWHRQIRHPDLMPPIGHNEELFDRTTVRTLPDFPGKYQDPEQTTTFQGMLFSPHTGTGTSRDPLLGPDEYRTAAQAALGWGKYDTFRPSKEALMLRKYNPDEEFSGEEIPFGPEHHEEFGGSNPTPGQQGLVNGEIYTAVRGVRAPQNYDDERDPISSYLRQRTDRPNFSRSDAEKEFEGMLRAVESSHIPISHLREMAEAMPGAHPTRMTDTLGRTRGRYSPGTGGISLQTGFSDSDTSETLVHELGHKRHLGMKGVSTTGEPNIFDSPDPVLEGVADAYRDQYADISRLTSDIPIHMKRDLKTTGYTTGHPAWRTGADADRYAAVRSISAEHGDEGRDSIPSRADLFHHARGRAIDDIYDFNDMAGELDRNIRSSNILLLGHLAETSPTARRAIGESRQTDDARKAYKKAMEEAEGPQPEQLSFDL